MLVPDWERGCSPDNNDGNSKNNPCPAIYFLKTKHSIYRKEGIIREIMKDQRIEVKRHHRRRL